MNPKETKTRVLVTGATGYIGSHLAGRLVKEKFEVHVLSRPGSDLSRLGEIADDIEVHHHDGTTDNMLVIIREAKPSIVFHLAAEVVGQHSPKDIDSLITSNILFGTQLLESAATCRVPYFINTGTYWQHYNNEDYSPVCLYAATKKAFEDIIQFYTESTDLKAITLKLFDVYGPDDPRGKLFPLLIEALHSQEPLSMTPGEQLLDLLYIDDVIEAYLEAGKYFAGHSKLAHQKYLVSSGQLVSVRDVVAIFEGIAGKPLGVKWGAKTYPARQMMTAKVSGKKLPGWDPQIGLKEGIERTIKGTR